MTTIRHNVMSAAGAFALGEAAERYRPDGGMAFPNPFDRASIQAAQYDAGMRHESVRLASIHREPVETDEEAAIEALADMVSVWAAPPDGFTYREPSGTFAALKPQANGNVITWAIVDGERVRVSIDRAQSGTANAAKIRRANADPAKHAARLGRPQETSLEARAVALSALSRARERDA